MFLVRDVNSHETYDCFDDLCRVVETWYNFLNDSDNKCKQCSWDLISEFNKPVNNVSDLQEYIYHIEEQIATQNGYSNFFGHGNYVVSASSRMGLHLVVSEEHEMAETF